MELYSSCFDGLTTPYGTEIANGMGADIDCLADVTEVAAMRNSINDVLAKCYVAGRTFDLGALRFYDIYWQNELKALYDQGKRFPHDIPFTYDDSFTDQPHAKWWCHVAEFDSLTESELAAVFVEDFYDDAAASVSISHKFNEPSLNLSFTQWLDSLRKRGMSVTVHETTEGTQGSVERRHHTVSVQCGWCTVKLKATDEKLESFAVKGFSFPQLWKTNGLTDPQIRELTENLFFDKYTTLTRMSRCAVLTIHYGISRAIGCGIVPKNF